MGKLYFGKVCGKCTLILLLLMVCITSTAGATENGKKSKKDESNASVSNWLPQIEHSITDPELRYPVMYASGFTVKSISYGWLTITRAQVRYEEVEPKGKSNEGFDLLRADIHYVETDVDGLPCPYLHLGKPSSKFLYVPQDHWGEIHSSIGILHWCSIGSSGTTSIAEAIKDPDAVVESTLTALVGSGDTAAIGVLLADNPDLAHHRDNSGATLLQVAAEHSKIDMAKLLLDHGADVNAKDDRGVTPLHAAVWQGDKEVAEFLLVHGADINAKDDQGVTPLRSIEFQEDFMQLLRQYLPSCREIHEAARNGDVLKVKALIDTNPDLVFVREQNGETPLYAAAKSGNKDVVELLLASGADIFAKSSDGVKLSVLANKNGHQEVAELLQHHETLAAAELINLASVELGSENVRKLENQVPRGIQAFSTGKGGTTQVSVSANGEMASYGAGIEFVSKNESTFFVGEQHPARLRLVAPDLTVADGYTAPFHVNIEWKRMEVKHDDVNVKGVWSPSGDGHFIFAGSPDSGGKWYVSEGEFQFRGIVKVGPYRVVFKKGEIVSTSARGGKATEGTVAEVDGVDYEFLAQVWVPL